jgi:DNA recombination protein RmuC
MAEPVTALGRSLESAASSYNRFVGSLEGRVFPAARQLRELSPGETPRELPEMREVETALREPRRNGEVLPAGTAGA